MINSMTWMHLTKNNIAYKNVDRKECVLYGFINIAFKIYDGGRVGNRYFSQGDSTGGGGAGGKA